MISHRESHRMDSVAWLRAAVLGANDGLISTSSLIVGVAAAQPDHKAVMLAGVAGMVAGAISMAAGEYVSVSSQGDAEEAELARERKELAEAPARELDELTGIYVSRGLTPELAAQVAAQLTERDALAAHSREELGILEQVRARPLQAAWASSLSFSAGAALPIAAAQMSSMPRLSAAVTVSSLVMLFGLGALAAALGGAPPLRGALRVGFWGAVAMASTALIGRLFGTGPVG